MRNARRARASVDNRPEPNERQTDENDEIEMKCHPKNFKDKQRRKNVN